MVSFFALGFQEKAKMRNEQLKANRDGEMLIKQEQEKKLLAQTNKSDIRIDFNFTDEDRDSALAKLSEIALKVHLPILIY